MMNTWEAIFSQSPANKGFYDGEKLPQTNWDWPKRTWFQARLNKVREHDRPRPVKATGKEFQDLRSMRTM